MKRTIKTISFVLLMLSLGLVLSACVKKTAKIGDENFSEDINIEKRVDQKDSQEGDEDVEGLEKSEELSVNDWRVYENEYFNIRFKYHQNWYFQRDKINEGDYIAVYGFAPSAEELNDKDYAIQLFILNSENNFIENFSYSQEKESGNKKYILVSNQEKYQEILDLMFENLEILDHEEEVLQDEISMCGVKIQLPSFVNKDDFQEVKILEGVCMSRLSSDPSYNDLIPQHLFTTLFDIMVVDKNKVDNELYNKFTSYEAYKNNKNLRNLKNLVLPFGCIKGQVILSKDLDFDSFNGISYYVDCIRQDIPGIGLYQIVEKRANRLIYVTYKLWTHSESDDFKTYFDNNYFFNQDTKQHNYNEIFSNYMNLILKDEIISKNIKELNNIYNF